MARILVGDEVIVTTGRDRGRRGTVLRGVVDNRVLVEGVNEGKRHMKPNPMKNQPPAIVPKAMPISVSNVAIFNSSTQKADKIAYTVVDGKKQRIFKSTKQPVPSPVPTRS